MLKIPLSSVRVRSLQRPPLLVRPRPPAYVQSPQELSFCLCKGFWSGLVWWVGTTTGNLELSQCQINVAYSWMDGLRVSQLAEFPCITRTWGLQAGRTPAREEKGFRGTLVRKGWALAVHRASSPHANLLLLLFSNPSRPACHSSCYDAWADPRPFSDRGFSTRARPPHRTSQLCSDHRGAEIR